MLRYSFCLLLLALTFIGCDEEVTPPEETNPFLIEVGSRPLIIAHRGGKGLMPENTMLAFNHAATMGVDVLEMDVVLTKDSVLVTIHDLTIDDTADSTGNVKDFTYAELQQFNFGHHFRDSAGAYPYRANPVRIPRLIDVLQAHPDMLLNIEIKDPGDDGKVAADKLVAAMKTYHTPKKLIAFTFDDDVIQYFRSINVDGIYTGASLNEGLTFYNAVVANTEESQVVVADVFSIPDQLGPFDFRADSLVDAVHAKGVAVHYWTINDKDEMKARIQSGADAIITDYPDRMFEVLDELGF